MKKNLRDDFPIFRLLWTIVQTTVETAEIGHDMDYNRRKSCHSLESNEYKRRIRKHQKLKKLLNQTWAPVTIEIRASNERANERSRKARKPRSVSAISVSDVLFTIELSQDYWFEMKFQIQMLYMRLCREAARRQQKDEKSSERKINSLKRRLFKCFPTFVEKTYFRFAFCLSSHDRSFIRSFIHSFTCLSSLWAPAAQS